VLAQTSTAPIGVDDRGRRFAQVPSGGGETLVQARCAINSHEYLGIFTDAVERRGRMERKTGRRRCGIETIMSCR
jgi:hypothetical protein